MNAQPSAAAATPPPPPLLPFAVLAGQDGTAPVRELRKANEILMLASALFAQAELGVTQCPEVCHVYPVSFDGCAKVE